MHIVVFIAVLAQAPMPAVTPRDSAFHVLNRLAYGARPDEADSVARLGVMRWVDRQLDADDIPDQHLAERERTFKILDYDRGDLANRYRDAVRERQRMQREAAASGDTMRPKGAGASPLRGFRELGGELQPLANVRAAVSERQPRGGGGELRTDTFN